MKISRRDFIKNGTFVAAFAGSALSSAGYASKQRNAPGVDDLSSIESSGDALLRMKAKDFKPYVGAEFMFLTASGAVAAVLSEVEEDSKVSSIKNSANTKNNYQSFFLSFQMPSAEFLQKNYQIWHPDFGQFSLFLVPDKLTDDNKLLLHAFINHP